MAGLEGYPSNSMYTYDSNRLASYGEVNKRPTTVNVLSQSRIPLRTSVVDSNVSEEEDVTVKYINIGVGLASIIAENLLSHPFVVLRRQCQVHNTSKRDHLTPFSLLPIIFRLHSRQGISALWKGLGSVLIIRGSTLAVEDLLSKVTPWPKELSVHTSLKSFGQHMLLKCTTLVLLTPFFSASLVETVQSDIASEKPGIFDVFKEGLCRVVSWGVPHKGRMLPVWVLVGPTVLHGLLKYLVSIAIKGFITSMWKTNLKIKQERQGAFIKDGVTSGSARDIEVTSSLSGLIISEILLYPMETVLHRLHLQGTRTIIDDLDSGVNVTPILTNYEGCRDCFNTIFSEEGASGLYKGFGAFVLQSAAHILVIKLTKLLLTEISNLIYPTPSQRDSTTPSSMSAVRGDSPSSLYPVDRSYPCYFPTMVRQDTPTTNSLHSPVDSYDSYTYPSQSF